MNKWILLIHQIAQDSPNLRVKIWRNLKKHGAVLFKNAVYMLPYSDEHEEIMQWLCNQIKEGGSDASLFITESLDKKQDEEIMKSFHEICDKEYISLIEVCDAELKKITQREDTEGISESLVHECKRKLNEILKSADDISKIDFFHAPQKEILLQKIASLQKMLLKWTKTSEKEIKVTGKVYQIKDFSGRKWATRKDIFIDRIASAWLIRRFIDPKARFVFVSKGTEKAPRGTVPFDMYGSEFTHHGEDCTFETLMKAFDLKDPALQSIAEMVHDIDLKDNKYGRKEADGIAQIVTGLSQKLKEDNKLLEKGLEIFDALYQNYSSSYSV
ncbi:MAG TPA: hypothetical protein DHU69_02940 [Deltaproteobacteria bacterium]|nr:MAG: hypothetical protein A2094_01045 [Planctomycetes bacterium GWE2_41_14]OHB92135.1 MAG: hypothetical protein A2Z58_04965 [Planctomycetes bacterium RIFCSPHIGHO2_12_42_15]OHC06313.1 MAG: hypothetical protein A3K50_10805 [Planctomycetes bacterium RIFOXYD12_FULL_42_12]OHC08754.1 MAG: hypothetical protein A2545_00800 [Planctomycetes bacterium RIFOXYD2_FULL_41_16]HCY18719.1 hypothetical protein [Deltaproteobacteria bacterium]